MIQWSNIINPNSIGGGDTPCDAKFSEKCPCSQNKNTAFIKQISLFDIASHDKYLKFQFKIIFLFTSE